MFYADVNEFKFCAKQLNISLRKIIFIYKPSNETGASLIMTCRHVLCYLLNMQAQ